MQQYTVYPVIKWVGGKRQLLPTIRSMLPKTFGKYFEPFFGGGALFCDIQPDNAVINDCNKSLVGMYKQIKKDPNAVCAALYDFQEQYNSKSSMEEKDALYYKFREDFNTCINNDINTPLSAALLIFLNKAGFNGLYRINASGKYNVASMHCKSVKAYEQENIEGMSKLLKKTKIMCDDFENACKDAKTGDFVFFDSPYYNTFDIYQSNGFSESDHIRLYNLFDSLSQKGAYCMLTNNNCDFIKNLYAKYNIKTVGVKRMINCNANNRTGKEVIITNYNIV